MKFNENIIDSDICLFLGAGASAPFGKLLMDSFVDVIQKNTTNERAKSLLDFLIQQKGKDLEEILEDLALFMDKKYYLEGTNIYNLSSFCTGFENMRVLADHLDVKIRKELIEHYRGIDNLDDILNKYNPLFDTIVRGWKTKPVKIPIFTTNYDDIVDELCCNQEKKFNLVNGTRHASAFRNYVLDFAEYDRFKPVEDKINVVLFKLHGSICWEWDKKRKIIRINPKPLFDDYDPEVTKFFIAPTRAKIATEYPYRILYEFLHRCLDKAKLFIIIGYSFRDYDSLTKFYSSLDFNPNLKLFILDGKAEELKEKHFSQYKDRIITASYFFGSDDEEHYLNLIKDEIEKI